VFVSLRALVAAQQTMNPSTHRTHLLGFCSTQGKACRVPGFCFSIFVDGTNLKILKGGNAEKIRHRRLSQARSFKAPG